MDEQQLVERRVVQPVQHFLGLGALVEQALLARDRQRLCRLPQLVPHVVWHRVMCTCARQVNEFPGGETKQERKGEGRGARGKGYSMCEIPGSCMRGLSWKRRRPGGQRSAANCTSDGENQRRKYSNGAPGFAALNARMSLSVPAHCSFMRTCCSVALQIRVQSMASATLRSYVYVCTVKQREVAYCSRIDVFCSMASSVSGACS